MTIGEAGNNINTLNDGIGYNGHAVVFKLPDIDPVTNLS